MVKRVLMLLLLFTIFVSGSAMAAGTLNILSWPGYHSPDLVKSFESMYDVKVNFIEVDTYEKMNQYLDSNPGQVDLIIFGELAIPGLIQDGKLQQLNKNLLPNRTNVDPMFLNLAYDPGNKYTLPYHYLFIGLAYNKDKITEADATLQNYFEPSAKLKGRIITFPDARYNVGFAMKYMGQSFNSVNKKDIDIAKILLDNLKNNATPGSGDLNRGIYDGLIAMNEGKADLTIYYYENPETIAYLIEDLKINVGFKIPEEGAMIGTDAMCIPKAAKNVETAHNFINFMYDPVNAAKSISYLGYAFPCTGVVNKLDSALANRIYIPMDLLRKCEFPVPLKPEEAMVYDNVWKEVFGN